jgi:hypothetical protein
MDACDIDFGAFERPFSAEVANQLDDKFKADPAYLRDEFIIPKKADLNSSTTRGGTVTLNQTTRLTVAREPE